MRIALPTSLTVTLTTALLAAGCADKPAMRPPAEPPIAQTTTTNAPPPKPAATPDQSGRPLALSDELLRACNVQLGNVDRAPKFDFDKSELSDADRNVLQQLATCVTTGPLKGRSLALVGRADARGETEYNMGLGEHRADAVKKYLQGLGVPAGQVQETSRGKLDATGTDEAGWQKDRRVDIGLR
jgi:peptidoglycan-associated lipoprotein